MEKLSQEIIEHITSYLEYANLKNIFTLSRRFQVAGESKSYTWRKLTIAPSDAERFLELCNMRRINYLENLVFTPNFRPLVNAEGRANPTPCRDSVDDLRALDEEFTEQIYSLFATLKRLENRVSAERISRGINLTIKTPPREADQWYCLHRNYVSWRIHLLSPEALPQISIIRALNVVQDLRGSGGPAPADLLSAIIDSRVLLDLTVKFQNLEYLGCQLHDLELTSTKPSPDIRHYTHAWKGPYRDSRHDFYKAFEACALLVPKSLKDLRLDFSHRWSSFPDQIDQRQLLPNLTKPDTHDVFSSSLRMLSYQLRKLHLVIMADENLFWPSNNDSEPLWPYLEDVNIMFHMATPKGGYYFHGLRGQGRVKEGFEISAASYPPLGPESDATDKEVDNRRGAGMNWSTGEFLHFRIVPDEELLNPFLIASAQSATRMPSLKTSVLWSPLEYATDGLDDSYSDASDFTRDAHGDLARENDELSFSWGVAYLAPNEPCAKSLLRYGLGESQSPFRQLWWKVGKWQPGKEVLDLFKKIGCQSHEEKLIEYWEDYSQTSKDNDYIQALADLEVLGRINTGLYSYGRYLELAYT